MTCRGEIGLAAFSYLVQDPRTKDLPMILETPVEEAWETEISVLKRLADMDGSEAEASLSTMVEEIQGVVSKFAKPVKEKKTPAKEKKAAATKSKGKGKAATKKRKREDSDEEEDDDDCGSNHDD